MKEFANNISLKTYKIFTGLYILKFKACEKKFTDAVQLCVIKKPWF